MNFNEWMKSTGLSDTSVRKYFSAIKGPLSDWAFKENIIQGNILKITNKSKFDAVAIKIKKLPIFVERNTTGHSMYSSALNKYSEYLEKGAISSIAEDIEEIVASSLIKATEKERLINARLGQGHYREELLAYWGQCAVTGYKNELMLVASHIKPWSRSSNIERLDKFNGLLLTPALDRAFDRGLISFSQIGKIKIAPSFQEPHILGITETMTVPLTSQHEVYMAYHRRQVFIKRSPMLR
jgi:hypothetical protein